MEGRDPARDETTYAAIFLSADACRAPQIDVVRTSVASVDGVLRVEVEVSDMATPPPCTYAAQSGVQRVFLQSGDDGIVVYREFQSVAWGAPRVSHCVIVGSLPAVCSGVGATSGDTVTWTVALVKPGSYDLRGRHYGTVFAQGMVTYSTGMDVGHLALSAMDFHDLPGVRL